MADGPPVLTRRERELLVALCRPLLEGAAFAPPAGSRQMAAELFVSEAAVKFHLANLYDKFGLSEHARRRPVPPRHPGRRGDPPAGGHDRRPPGRPPLKSGPQCRCRNRSGRSLTTNDAITVEPPRSTATRAYVPGPGGLARGTWFSV